MNRVGPFSQPRRLILAVLLALAAAAWLLVLRAASQSGGQSMDLTMGMSAPLFLAIWVAMTVAMMVPAAAPMVQMFARVAAGKQAKGQPFVPVWVFVSGYLAVWTLFGLCAYLAALAAGALGERSAWLMANGARLGGVLFLTAGVYQLTPLKRACLAKCRTPLSFILTSWRDGVAGALRMGGEHGVFCLGCCWAMMLVLFVAGVMSIPWMALLSVAIFLEKNSRQVVMAGYGLATLFLLSGVALLLQPSLLHLIRL